MNCQETLSTTESMDVTITCESPCFSQINENKSTLQTDCINLEKEDKTECSDIDKHVNEVKMNSDDNIDMQSTDIEIISENTNDFGNHKPVTQRDETSLEISKNCDTLPCNSLAAIAAEYNSDTDANTDTEDNACINTNTNSNLNKSNSTDSIEVLYQGNKSEYRTQEKDAPSSEDSESDSDSNSDSSDSSSDSSSVIVTSNDSDDCTETNRNNKNNKGKPKEKELKSELDDLPPIEDLKISVPEETCDPIGEVAWTVEQLVVVRPKAGKPTLNLDTVLFIDKGKRALGKVFDVFGQVADPHYCVRFNSSEHIKENEIKVGMTVYYCPNTPYTTLVFVHELTKMKASDAVGDDEVPDFSDDEEERQYYENLRQKQVNGTVNSEENVPQKRRRKSSTTSTWQSNHPWNRNTKTHNYKERKAHVRNKDSSVHPVTPNPTNLWSWSPSSYQNGSHYSPHFQQMHSANSELYGHVPYSDNSHINSTNQDLSNTTKYNFRPQYNNSSTNRLPLINSSTPFGASLGFESSLPMCVNRHNTFPSPNARFPHPNMYWQPQPPHVTPPWSLLSPPPPPPPLPAEENHNTPQ